MNNKIEHIGALGIILYFAAIQINIGGIQIIAADLVGLGSIVLIAGLFFSGKLYKDTLHCTYIMGLFIIYMAFNGVINSAPVINIMIEIIQWISIICFLCLLHQFRLLQSPRFFAVVALYAFAAAVYTALWHIITIDNVRDFKQLHNAKYLFGFSTMMLYLFRRHIKYSHLLILFAAILLVLSGERKAILGLFTLVICDYFFCRAQKNNITQNIINISIYSWLAIGLTSIVAIYLWFGSDFILHVLEFSEQDMLFADQNDTKWNSNLWRKLLLLNGYTLFQDNWLFGVGPKMLPTRLNEYFHVQDLVTYTHNFPLDIAIEYGVFGLIILFGGYFYNLRKTFNNRLNNPVAYLVCIYGITMTFFVATQSSTLLLFMLPFFIQLQTVKQTIEQPACSVISINAK